jgi:hypothetical protein
MILTSVVKVVVQEEKRVQVRPGLMEVAYERSIFEEKQRPARG